MLSLSTDVCLRSIYLFFSLRGSGYYFQKKKAALRSTVIFFPICMKRSILQSSYIEVKNSTAHRANGPGPSMKVGVNYI